MHLSSFPAYGLEGLLAAEKPPVWALCVLEETVDMLRQTGSASSVAMIEKEIERIEVELARRCS